MNGRPSQGGFRVTVRTHGTKNRRMPASSVVIWISTEFPKSTTMSTLALAGRLVQTHAPKKFTKSYHFDLQRMFCSSFAAARARLFEAVRSGEERKFGVHQHGLAGAAQNSFDGCQGAMVLYGIDVPTGSTVGATFPCSARIIDRKAMSKTERRSAGPELSDISHRDNRTAKEVPAGAARSLGKSAEPDGCLVGFTFCGIRTTTGQHVLSNPVKRFGQGGGAAFRALSTTFTPPDWDGRPSEQVGGDPYAITDLALDSVVKVFSMSSSPNYFLPWQNKPQREITGSGFVISGRRIVTNAHVIADQTYVVVRKHGSPLKYRAEVQAVGHECDLALLRVRDEEFWEGMKTLQLGDIPFLQESVAVVGYPQGGDNISVTGGVVSRVELTQYVHGTAHLMAIQIDAAINPGNSGGPALMDGKVVGVAFQNLAGAENIGYIIPVPIIKHFLQDVDEEHRYVGFCSLGLTCQATENPQLREHLKMPPGLTGVLVNKIQPLTDSNKWMKKDDVLVEFDGAAIANDGTVHFRNRERISFDHLVSLKTAGEKVRLTILRDGDMTDFEVKVDPLRFLVPIHQFDRLPSYFIFAGLVFTPLTQPYLHEYGDDWYNSAPRRLCERALTGILTKPGEELVILSQVLVDDVNAGYERLADYQVLKVNGVAVDNLRHLMDLVEGCSLPSLRFDLEEGRVVVLNFKTAMEASPKILLRHRIPSHASIDLLEELQMRERNDDVELQEEKCELQGQGQVPDAVHV